MKKTGGLYPAPLKIIDVSQTFHAYWQQFRTYFMPLPFFMKTCSDGCLYMHVIFSWQVVKNGLDKGQAEGYKKEAEVTI